MRSNFSISTTSSISNMNIEKHIDLVSANIVVGTNIFSDISASFSDFFGGQSSTYQNKLQEIYKAVMAELKLQAINIGANAIIGLKIDFDEISGGGKSMFMISAVGTAVVVSGCADSSSAIAPHTIEHISSLDLSNELTKNRIIRLLKSGKPPLTEHWQYLFNYPNDEITTLLLNLLLQIPPPNAYVVTIFEIPKDNIINYLRRVDRDFAVSILYPKITEFRVDVINILEECQLFSPRHIISLIQDNELSVAVLCLFIGKDVYTKDDLVQMTKILDLFDSLPDTGEVKIVKGGMLSKEKERYICSTGHTNSVNSEYCEGLQCGLNIKGLRKHEVRNIANFRVKVDSLRLLFENK